MFANPLMLAESFIQFEWWTWLCIALLIAIIVGYKMYQKKMMG